MRITYLEKLAAAGVISPEAAAEIHLDCHELLKTAMFKLSPEDEALAARLTGKFSGVNERIKKYLNDPLISMAVGGAMTTALGEAVQSRRTKRELNETVSDFVRNREAVTSDPTLAPYQDKAYARFNEIAQLAPSIIGNRAFMDKMVRTRLQSGLSDQDVTNLAMMEAAAVNPRFKSMASRAVAEKTASGGSVDPAAARLGEVLADCYTIVKEASEVETLGKATKKWLVRGVLGTSASILGALGVGAVNSMLAKRDASTLGQRQRDTFEKAMSMADPDKSPLHTNREKALQAFQTLVHFAPHVATEPNAAKAFMEKLVSYDMGIQTDEVKNLTDIERNMKGSGGHGPFVTGLSGGLSAMGFDHALKENMKEYYSDIASLGKPKGPKPGSDTDYKHWLHDGNDDHYVHPMHEEAAEGRERRRS